MKRVTLFAGHYGSGKTNLAVNLALSLAGAGRKTLIADLDIVNPYFRARDSEAALNSAGVRVIASKYANSNVDVPALPQEMYAVVDDKSCWCVVDVGGDDRGALALGRLAPGLKLENDYDFLFVVNFYRPLTRTADAALKVLREVEQASGLKFAGIINNSNLGRDTAAGDVMNTVPLAKELANASGLARVYTSAREDIAPAIESEGITVAPIRLRTRADWAIY